MTKEELRVIFDQHRLWLLGQEGGKRANLNGASLKGANLESANLRDANLNGAYLESANLRDANLNGANLESANLDGADLKGANLVGANLAGANLAGAYLAGAYLVSANLDSANLKCAYLVDANLKCADLNGVHLEDANLAGAYLEGANLVGANLSGANLESIKQDIYAILDLAKPEVPGLLKALQWGGVNGSTYEGACACLVGTIANLRGCKYRQVAGIEPDYRRPAERWFLAIRQGDTPQTSQVSRITEGWITEYLARL
jgi:uncharacterized protein YjbI with pentapeptide repeats